MTELLKQTFAAKKAQNKSIFVAFVTAGHPHPDSTVDTLLALQRGGADVIELGVPFSDPVADGAAIQESNNVALEYDVGYAECLDFVRQARTKGLHVPVLLMGYYNPILAYGEERAVRDAHAAGANGFIVVDLPPEEAVDFRKQCTKESMSYVPLIAPSTSDSRIAFLSTLADSFIYVVSKMGTTGASNSVNTELPAILSRIRAHTQVPLAVGFGVSTREHFLTVAEHADGVVIGSTIIHVLKTAREDERAEMVEKYCAMVTGRDEEGSEAKEGSQLNNASQPNGPSKVAPPPVDGVADATKSAPIPGLDTVVTSAGEVLPPRFGEFGGQYVPEALFDCLVELEAAHRSAKADPEFWKEFESLYGYIGRPSELYLAERLTEKAGGANIWFKREDLNHTGSHKINNAIGQILLARRLGKTRIIAETGAGQHGVATATVCARFGMECVIYMGAEDVRRQALNAFRIKMLGGKVVAVESGSKTLKDAINEAFRDWVTNLSTTHYLVGSAIGPHPFPSIVRDFQSVIGKEVKEQMMEKRGKLPEAVVACVGGGSNAIGMFHPFIEDKSVRMVGVEAAGDGVDTVRHSATLAKGTKGVLHGVRTYILQSKVGQILETHSVSAGLDYPGVGPEHAHLKDSGRAEYVTATDEEALRGFRMLTELEGIIPALETSHAIWGAYELARGMAKGTDVVVVLSGRGDKDVEQIAELLQKGDMAKKLDWHVAA